MTDSSTVLFLGPDSSPVFQWLKGSNEPVIQTLDKISGNYILANKVSFLVSHGYRHIIRRDVLDLLPGRAVNLHISYLPWNRGADPNLWSWVDNTPKGVTIHHIDEGVDTGDIICQKEVTFDPHVETLASSYAKLQLEMFQLFELAWPSIRNLTYTRVSQNGAGTSHRIRDKEKVSHLLINGWDTPVVNLVATQDGQSTGKAKGK